MRLSGTRGGRTKVIWLVVASVLGAIVASGAAWALAGLRVTHNGPRAAENSGGSTDAATATGTATRQWSGTLNAYEFRKSEWIIAGYTVRGDFWFRADGDGRIKGHATVAYEPIFNVERLDAAVKYIKDYGNAVTSLVSGGPLLALAKSAKDVGIATYTGLYAVPDRSKALQSGPITGSLRNGKLSLQWAKEQPKGIPVKVTMRFIKKDKLISDTAIPLASPWRQAANVLNDPGPAAESIWRPDKEKTKNGVEISRVSTWSAHQVG